MGYKRTKIINICDKVILFSIYAVIFFLPISKALIETFSCIAIAFFIIKKSIDRKDIVIGQYLKFGVITYVIICLFSIVVSSNPKISSRSFIGKVMQDVFFFLVIIDTLNNERRIRNAIYILFFSSFVLGVDGVYQHFTRKDFLRHRSDLGIPRIYASFVNPNGFGCYLITIIPFLIVTFFAKLRTKIFKFAIVGLFLLLFTCLILSVSRGAWLGFVASVLFLGIWLPSIAAIFIILALLLLVMRPFFQTLIKDRLSNLFNFFDPEFLTDVGSLERKIFWRAGWRMFLSSPIIGVGVGTFMFNYKKFLTEDYPFGPFYAHNCYLQMAAEIGVIGLSSFLLILLLFYLHGIRSLNSKNVPKTYSWYILLGSLAAILGYCVQMGVDTFLYSVDLGLLFWLILGIGTATAKIVSNRQVVNSQGKELYI